MRMASRSAYGRNPHAGIDMNADRGWGGYAWPKGVPGNLLGTTDYQQIDGLKQRVRVTCRAELVDLFTLAFALADQRYGYQLYVTGPDGKPWGPWGYENRPISGTSTPSNHSKGKAFDVNAPNNPYSAKFITDLPPGLVADWERIGFYWGGRYEGSQDNMHFEYCGSPGDVAGHVATARQLLGQREPAKPRGVLMALTDAQQDELYRLVKDLVGKVSFIEQSERIPVDDANPSKGSYPFTKSAANFNDVREIGKVVDSIKGELDWLLQNERIPVDASDPTKGDYPFTRSAANFDDVRRLETKLDALIAASTPKA